MHDFQPSTNTVRDQRSLRRRSDRRSALRNRYAIAPYPPRGDSLGAVVRLTIDIEDTRLVGQIRAMLPKGSRFQMDLVDPWGADRLDSAATPEAFDTFDLTERQREVITLLMQGLSNKAIGRSLSLSHFTVRNHISQVMRLLGVSSRKEVRSMIDGFPINPAPVAVSAQYPPDRVSSRSGTTMLALTEESVLHRRIDDRSPQLGTCPACC